MSDILQLSDADFEQEVIKSELPVMVDFWAEWCGPCKIVGPTVEELAKDYEGKVKIAKMDVDKTVTRPRSSASEIFPPLFCLRTAKFSRPLWVRIPRVTLKRNSTSFSKGMLKGPQPAKELKAGFLLMCNRSKGVF